MIGRMVLFGASGDLTARFLMPALGALQAAGRLPEGFGLVGAARESWDDEVFRRHAAAALERHGADVPVDGRRTLVDALTYRQVELAEPSSVAGAVQGEGPVATYLALPPGLFASTVTHLAAAHLPAGSRVAIEKPFGEDLAGAVSLNELFARLFGAATEQTLFRVDHVLGMATVQNLEGLRLHDRILDSVWNSTHIEEIQVLWEEDLALEGRAAYYDGAGALKDVMQNHMLQILCVLAMEPPGADVGASLRDHKAAVLRNLRAPSAEAASWTRRARYTAGRLGDRTIPAYAEEEGVEPERCTETFAEVRLELDAERWRHTRFLLRAGKALGQCHREVVVRFRPSDRRSSAAEGARNELRIGIEGPEDLALTLVGSGAGSEPRPEPMRLSGPPPASELPAYGRVLLDLLEGGSALSVRGDAAEAAWRVMTPVLEAWASGGVRLEEYPAGSGGPPPRQAEGL